MIAFNHVGIRTHKNITQICMHLKENGINSVLEMNIDGTITAHLMPENGHIMMIIKLYDRDRDSCLYEMKFDSERDYKYMYDILKML